MNRVDNASYNNDWFKSTIGAGRFKQILWYFINIIFLVNPLNPFSGIKCFLLKCFGARVGRGVVIKPGVNIKYPWKLSIGNYTWIGEKVWIDNITDVIIGDNVCLSQDAMLLAGNHNYKKSTFDLMIGKIVLEDGVWIGAKAVVCPGVVVQSHSILTVSSVLTKDTEAYGIYQGNPAEKVRIRQIK
ncbi:MAG: WcaF family extracellular polysaccharide biosynthesis acetyltransferase [Chitinophagaceae bacterium]|nr:WcaF family extracellular polysaccharide biosynthesis acetyltransferase [Chitinophagaceae bacterium]MCW5926339.1 WcaF family extracellular polysaccharide biosynthesis acetyltransferase [Chitinophagaceae bacterium]